MDYELIKCDCCGGTIGIFDRRTFSCQNCGKQFNLCGPDYDILLTNEMTGWIFPVIDKPLKLVYEDDVKVVENNDGTMTFKRTLKPLEAEQVLKCMFGTTDIGILDCSDMTNEEIDKIVDKLNKIPN